MKAVGFVLLSWAAMVLSVQCCTYSENSTSEISVELYQVLHLVNIVANTDNFIAKVDLLRNTVTLPSGRTCEYNSGLCFDEESNQNYTWEALNIFLEDDSSECNLKQFSTNFNYTYKVATLNEEPLVQFLIAGNTSSTYNLQLMKKDTRCSKDVWRTNREDILVAMGEENFIDTNLEDSSSGPVGIDLYGIEESEDMYGLMTSMCEEQIEKMITVTTTTTGSQLEDEVANLKASVAALQNVVGSMQEQLMRYKEENQQLKEAIRLKDTIGVFDDNEPIGRAYSQLERLEALPQTFSNTFDGFRNCPNFILFPYENIFCILIAIIYLVFSVLNTITNYLSLRLLRNKKQKCFVFYTLTQGLTSLYVSRCLNLTKQRIDKWLLDLE